MNSEDTHLPEVAGGEPATPVTVRHPWRTFFQSLVSLVPTANGLLLVVQSVLVQPPFDTSLPGWAFLAVNGAVVIAAAATRMIAVIAANPTLRHLTEQVADDEEGGRTIKEG